MNLIRDLKMSNWYKKIKLSSYNWDKIRRLLEKKLGREPTTEEVQEAMLSNLFHRKKKKYELVET